MISLDDIFDQPAAIGQLRKAAESGRIPHGLIFAGLAGVGKATTAAAIATLFLCEQPKRSSACGKCESCRAMEAGAHPDFHVITKELIRYHDKGGKSKGINLSVDVIRPEVVAKTAMTPVMGRGKVFVIEQADLMTAAAQNALLKTLEEPAGRTLLILLTDQSGGLLATIRSRCQLIPFAALSKATVLRELQQRGADQPTAQRAAELASGSLGEALRWIEDGVIEPAAELLATIDGIFSSVHGNETDGLPEWFKTSAEAYAQKQLERDELSSKDQATRQAMGLYLHLAAEHLRKKMPGMNQSGELERACVAIDAIHRAEQYIDANVSIPLVFEELSVSLQGR